VKIEKLKYLLVIISALTVFSVSVPKVKANPSQNPIFTTIEDVNQLISDAISPLQESISSLFGTTDDLEEEQASMLSRIEDLEDRVAVLENAETPICVQSPLGLLSWWTGDGNADDIVGTNEGGLNNGATFIEGKVGQAFSFDGVDDFVQGTTNNLPIGNEERTLEMWIKVNSSVTTEEFFAGYGTFGSGTQIYVLGATGLNLFFSQWGSAVFGTTVGTESWRHIAVTNSGNLVNLYLDGTLIASGELQINTPLGTPFYMGRAPGSFGDTRRLNGYIDEVSIYNRALTLDEIKSIFDAGANGKCK